MAGPFVRSACRLAPADAFLVVFPALYSSNEGLVCGGRNPRELARGFVGLRVLVLLPLLLCACAAGSDQGSDDGGAALATVDGSEISADDFRARYRPYLLRTGLQDDQRLRQNILREMIADRLLVIDAFENGIDRQPEYQRRREIVRRKLLIDLLTRRTVYDGLQVTEDDLAAMFVRANTRLKARHLYTQSLEDAERLRVRLDRGERFEDLAREVFSDTALANNGGSVGYFEFDEMDPAFEEAAYALKVGEISAPVRTTQGYSIIQLEDRMANPVLTENEFAAARGRLKTYVLDRKRTEARRAYVQEVAAALSIRFDDPALDFLMRHVEGRSALRAGDADENWLARPLVRFDLDGRPVVWSIAAFGEEAQMTGQELRGAVRSRIQLEEFIRGVVSRQVLVARAERAGLEREPHFEEALEYELERWVAGQVRQSLVERVAVPEDSVRNAYRRFGGDFSFDEARAPLLDELRRRAGADVVRAFVDTLREQSDIHVRTDLLAALPLVEERVH